MEDEPMRIAYLISCFLPYNTGNGGHYYSLMTIASAYVSHSSDAEVKVFSFGNRRPSAIHNFPGPWQHINVSAKNILSADHEVSAWKPTHIHAFDRRSLFFARRAAKESGAKVLFTKPGGPNSRYLPIADHNIFFSKENFDFYSRRLSKYHSRFSLVPQRTSPVPPARNRLALLERELVSPRVRVLRISRIGEYYKDSIAQTISLAEQLRAKGFPASALIIGTVESPAVAQTLRASLHQDDAMITDPDFTNKAAELVDIADIVVGTGRGFMEAAMAGVPVLCPTQSGLVLLTRNSLEVLRAKNFSARVDPGRALVDASLEIITRAISCSDAMTELRSETKIISNNNFDVTAAIGRYDEIYRYSKIQKKPRLDTIMLFLGVAQAVLNSSYNNVEE